MGLVLITGGLGFAGRHIVRALAASGYKVISYNRDYSESDDAEHVIAVQGELFDIPRLVRVMQEHAVEAVIHTAAMSHPTLSLDFPLATFAANVDGTLGVLEAARLAGVRRIVNFSSETVYGLSTPGDRGDPGPSDDPVRSHQGRDRVAGRSVPQPLRRDGDLVAHRSGL